MQQLDIRKGPMAPTLLRLSLPVLAGQAFNLLYNVVDTYFIALIDRGDPWLVGATGLVFPLVILFMAVMFGISGGISSLVARAIGAGKSDELDRTAESGLFIGVLASLVFLGLLYPLATPILVVFGGSGPMLGYAHDYLVWVLPMVPFMFLGAVFTGILQGEGRTKHMMVSMILGTVVNIILDPVLIFSAGMGIAGAGLATAIANFVGFTYLVAVFVRSQAEVRIHWKVSRISGRVMGEIIRVGLPQGIMQVLASLSFIFYNRIMTDLNPVILSSFTLYSRLEQMALIPLWSLANGMGTVAGQAAGAKDIGRMSQTFRTGTVMGVVTCGTLLAVFVALSGVLFRIFQSDATVLDLAGRITPWMALGSFLFIPIIGVGTILSVSGFATRSLVLTVVRIYGFSVPGAWIGAYVLGRSVDAVMVALVLAAVLSVVTSLLVYGRFMTGLATGRLAIRAGV